MNDQLLKNPDVPFTFDDDAQCKKLLSEIGILGRFSADPIKGQTSTTQAFTDMNHKTHWILAMLFLGKTKASDNGYYVVCLPKSGCTIEQFCAACAQFTKGQGSVGAVGLFPGDASDN
jgi:hypothetical protein